MANYLPAVQETLVQSLGQEDAQGKEVATHFRVLAWEIPWTEEPGGLQSTGARELHMTKQLNHHPRLCIHEHMLVCDMCVKYAVPILFKFCVRVFVFFFCLLKI